jgi:hypothetical protein
LLNRILRYNNVQANVIYAEKRGSELDTELTAEYDRLSKVGVRFFSRETVREKTSLTLVSKKQNLNGLQIIDLILASLARSALGKGAKMVGNDLSPSLIKVRYAYPPTFFP